MAVPALNTTRLLGKIFPFMNTWLTMLLQLHLTLWMKPIPWIQGLSQVHHKFHSKSITRMQTPRMRETSKLIKENKRMKTRNPK